MAAMGAAVRQDERDLGYADLTAYVQADARVRGLLDSVPDAIVTSGADGRIVLVNSQAEQLFGYSRAELIGQPVELLLPARLRKVHVQHRSTYAALPRTRPMGLGLEL